MKKIAILSSVLLLGFFAARCSKNPVAPRTNQPPRALTAQEVQLIGSDNLFGLKLFAAVSEAEGHKNVFISPLSVSMAMGMTLNGADGETYTAMKETLELNGLTEEEINRSYQSLIDLLTNLDYQVVFEIANSIWYRDTFPIAQPFIDVNQEYFDAEVQGLDFSRSDAADVINGWVKEKTKGKIEEIVASPIDPAAVMFLINAIYFKGDWMYQFDKGKTEDEDFTLIDGSTIKVPMMEMEDVSFPYYSNEDFQAVELSYGDSLFCMTIVLPHPDRDIDSVIAGLDEQAWGTLIDQLWNMYHDMPDINKWELRDQLGPLFEKAFLSRETRNYEAIPMDEMQYWVKVMGGEALDRTALGR